MPDAYDANRKLMTNPSLMQAAMRGGIAQKEGITKGVEELRQEAADREREKEDQKWLERRDRLEPANNDSFSEITRKDPYDDDDDDDDYEMSEDLTGAKELIKKFERPDTFIKEKENAQNFLDNYKMNLLS